jgi:hypothetical protein
MKAKGTLVLAGLLCVSLINGAWAQKVTPTQIFMRKKLGYSQNIVEGIALERYEQVATNAVRLWRMTQTNTWTALKNAAYLAKSERFQLDTAALVDAAHAKDTAKVLEAYSQVTADCVSCHQYARREQFVRRLPGAAQAVAVEKPRANPPPGPDKK